MVPLKRLYLRNLPNNVGEDELLKYLSIYGKIHEVKIVHDYAFVQFESEKDARDVLETFQRQPFLGRNIVVEFARPLRKDMPSVTSGTTDSRSRIRSSMRRHLPSHVQSRYPVIVTNIPRNIRWQELKDFGRTFGGLVAYCDLDRKKHGRGFIEYFSKDDAERAIQELNGKRLGGKRVTVSGITVTYRRSRSRSPLRSHHDSRHWPPNDNATSPVPDPVYPDANARHCRDTPPPSYAYRHTPASYHTQHSTTCYHSPVLPPLEPESRLLVEYNPTPRHGVPYGGERYDDRLGRLDNWKYGYYYDYGYDAGYDTARLWEERKERQEFDPFQHYQR